MSQFAIQLIRLYQATLSPDHGWFRVLHPYGYCRFRPTCSEYSSAAFAEHGFLKGLFLSVARLSRCHPWGAVGADNVPSKNFSN